MFKFDCILTHGELINRHGNACPCALQCISLFLTSKSTEVITTAAEVKTFQVSDCKPIFLQGC